MPPISNLIFKRLNMKSRVLVVGANGYIAKNIIGFLEKNSSNLNITTSSHDGLNADHTLNYYEGYDAVVKNVDTIIFCSALLANHKDISKVNTEFPLNLYIQANKAGVRHFVFLSTTLVSGYKTDQEILECSFQDKYDDPYSQTKANAEKKLNKAKDKTSLISLRLSHVYDDNLENFRGIFKLFYKLQKFNLLILPKQNIKKSMLHIDNLNSLIIKVIYSKNISGTFFVNDGYYYNLDQISKFVSASSNRNGVRHLHVNFHIFGLLSNFLRNRYPQFNNLTENLMFSISNRSKVFNWIPSAKMIDEVK